MSAKDLFHNLVKTALQDQGWIITHDPYRIELEFTDLYLDLGAETLLAAIKNQEKIAVEIKSFLATSTISDFHLAVGQFINYKIALEEQEPERKLYLAVPLEIYQRFFQYSFIQKVISINHIALLIYDVKNQEISQWIN